jgi:CRP/FNR family transcriptional regulator, cyclic AMP receptor protein
MSIFESATRPPLPRIEPSVSLPKGSRVFREGEPVRCVYFITHGVVKLVSSAAGREVLVATRTRGWILGAVAAILNKSHRSTAITMSECQLVPLPLTEFHESRYQQQDMSMWLHDMLAREVEEQLARSRDLVTANVRGRLEQLLGDLLMCSGRTRTDGSVKLTLSVTVTEIADLIGASREQVSRTISRLVKEGILRRHKNWFEFPSTSPIAARVRQATKESL